MSKEWESFSEVGIDVPSTESAAMISSQVSTGKKQKCRHEKFKLFFGDFSIFGLYFVVFSYNILSDQN